MEGLFIPNLGPRPAGYEQELDTLPSPQGDGPQTVRCSYCTEGKAAANPLEVSDERSRDVVFSQK